MESEIIEQMVSVFPSNMEPHSLGCSKITKFVMARKISDGSTSDWPAPAGRKRESILKFRNSRSHDCYIPEIFPATK